MPIVLLRVDERLIHGQVVVGWGTPLHPDRIVVVDDDIAGSGWEQDLYRLGVTPELEAVFLSVADAAKSIESWRRERRRSIVLLRDIATLLRLAPSLRPADGEINLGGVHFEEGRTEALPYLYLSPDERAALRRLREMGLEATARDLPASRRVPLDELLGRS
ncbi:MAG: PTS sugar transporter subunit IIB [Gemmatimonadota bacterium]|nr:PTS sugar transporter subunit IIB [Gemmatimonadota bacterium]